jgi:hypothetical protein
MRACIVLADDGRFPQEIHVARRSMAVRRAQPTTASSCHSAGKSLSVSTTVGELDPRSRDEVAYRARDENLARAGQRYAARADVDGDPCEVVPV